MPKRNRKQILNQMKTEFSALSVNEGLSRSMICAMVAQLDVSVDALADVRCAVSEAVTNAVVHGYGNPAVSDGSESGAGKRTVYILTTLYADRSVKIIIRDRGCGIPDIARAMEPMYTTDPTGERSGMGFAIMQSFMDSVRVRSIPGRGTTVELRKAFAAQPDDAAHTVPKRRKSPAAPVYPDEPEEPEETEDTEDTEDTENTETAEALPESAASEPVGTSA